MLRKRSLTYLKWLSKKAKLLRNTKLSQFRYFYRLPSIRKRSNNIRKYEGIRVIKFHQIIHQKDIFQQLAKRKPLLIVDGTFPSFKYPKYVNVIISKKAKQKAGTNSKTYIPYQKQNQNSSIFMQIPFKQFYQYQGQFELSIAQMSLDKKSVILPAYIEDYFSQKKGGLVFSSIQKINLWYYKGERISTWHYDGHDNFLFVKEGCKKVYLMPPNSFANKSHYVKSKTVFDVNWNHALEPTLFQKNRIICSTTVSPGQCLYIPRGWWHYVHSLGLPNIALNVWGNSIQKQLLKGEQDLFLRHIIHEASEQLSKSNFSWESLSSEMREKYRQANFLLFFNKLLRNIQMTEAEGNDHLKNN